jgi:hypothetical protein
MDPRTRAILHAFILTMMVWLPRAALAQEDAMTEAAQRFQKGVELFDEGEHEAALAEFHWAYSLKPHFAVLYNIAQCYYATGEHEKALEYFKRYMDEGGDQIPKKRATEVNDAIAHLLDLVAELTVTTHPDGASVRVDGKLVGTAPFAGVYVTAGAHVVEVAYPGYMPLTEDMIFTGGQKLNKIFKLKEDSREGTIEVISSAPKTKVYIDDREMGAAPWKGKLIVGEHKIVLMAPGYHDATRPIVLKPGEERTIEIEMDVKGQPGKLVIATDVQGVQVYVDGMDEGQTPLKGFMLPPGIYKVRTAKDGYADWEGDVTVQENTPTSVQLDLRATAGKVGPAGFWVAASLTVASLAVAGTFGILTLGKKKEFESFLDAIPTGSEGANEVKLTDKYNRLKDEGRRYALIADVCWGLGGAAGLTTIFLAFFTQFRKPTSKARIEFGPVAGGAYLSLTAPWSL